MWNVYEFVMKLDSVLYGLYPSRIPFSVIQKIQPQKMRLYFLYI